MRLKDICYKYDLEAPKAFWDESEEKLAYIYNGAGPDWLPKWGRDVLTYFLELFKGAMVIHDWEYEYSDKTQAGFDDANARMWRNFKRIINIEYPFRKFWLWFRRSHYRGLARLAYRFCKLFGWSAWVDETKQGES